MKGKLRYVSFFYVNPRMAETLHRPSLNERSDGVQLPECAAHLGYPRRQSGDFSRRGNPVAPGSKLRAPPPKSTMEHCGPFDSILSKIHQASVHVFFDTVFATSKLPTRWKDRRGGSTTSKGITSKFFDCEFHANPGMTAMKLLEGTKQHVSWTNDSMGNECTPNPYPYSTTLVGLLNELAGADKPHRSDGPNFPERRNHEIFVQDV